MNTVAWALDLVERTHQKSHGNLLKTKTLPRIEECMDCLRYWIRLVWPQQERVSDAGLIGSRHRPLGKYLGGDPDDVREAREEIKRDREYEP